MIRIRRAEERGHADHGWLDTYHTFSFADYYDPAHMGFRALRVINEDRVRPGHGFGMHGHRDMEIVTCVLEGALQHRDSLGGGAILKPGEMQRITAGTGVMHSEFNPSLTEPVHLYQIWLLPEHKGLVPDYEQRSFPEAEKQGRWQLVASRDGRDGSLTVHQDVALYLASLAEGEERSYDLVPGRHTWLQVLRGDVALNRLRLAAGDGAAVSDEERLTVRADAPSEVMLFDLA
ncbi:MAG: pirin family protein [Planctomycetes bacterium]|nr:pirin family protein [Planctomycetota bacterium]